MPPFQASPIGRNLLQAVPGLPVYLWGSLNRTVAPTRMTVTAVQLTSPTAQVTGTVIEGQIPVVGQLVSISGAVPAYFNVTNAKITAVSAAATPDVGVYTISFALTNANIPTTASPGLAIAPQVEVGESVVNGASIPVALQANVNPDQGRTIRADVEFSAPSGGSATVTLQSADSLDGTWEDLAVVAQMTGGTPTHGSVVLPGITANFLRYNNSALAGVSSATIVAKVLV